MYTSQALKVKLKITYINIIFKQNALVHYIITIVFVIVVSTNDNNINKITEQTIN